MSGTFNTANGNEALFSNTSGYLNTANGLDALYSNTNGNYNTANGAQALQNNTSGAYNIALGYLAGYSITTGGNNIDIGNEGVSTDTNIIRIGYSQTATFVAGISGVTVSGTPVVVNSSGQLGVAPSSQRFKDNIRKMADASDMLYSLQPVTFRYKPGIDPQGTPQFGLVAEEVEQVDPNLVVHKANGEIFTVRYDAVNAMLLNEFLKEHHKVQDLEQRLEKLEQLLNAKNGGGQ